MWVELMHLWEMKASSSVRTKNVNFSVDLSDAHANFIIAWNWWGLEVLGMKSMMILWYYAGSTDT